jgi:prepilin-type N-terminal cleavage/methylation domain-containing protein
MKTIRRHSARRTSRSAFTLVELMIVIVIITILASILIPTIGRVIVRTREAQVITEINGLTAAIAAFKSKYGVEPPSRITIYLTGDPVGKTGWFTPTTTTAVPAQNMALVRSIWPQFDFTMGGGAGASYPAYWSTIAVNDGFGNQVVNFNCGECLLFFLGGVMNATGTPPTGFAKSPKWPFAPASVVANREGPFFEFTNLAQLTDIDSPPNGVNEWKDPLPGQTNPYLYFSSYDGQGYRIAELPQSATSYLFIHDFYRVSATSANPPASPSATPTGSQTLPAQKPQTFQIISPGYDTNYGSGGVFNTNLTNSGLTDSSGNPDSAAYDNLTNFNAGRLNP